MPTSSTSTTSLSSSIDLNGLRELLSKQLLEFLIPLETYLTSKLDHDVLSQLAIQKIRDIVTITEQWVSTCDDINVSTAWVEFILDWHPALDKELLELFVTFVEHTNLPVARFDILKHKLTQQQNGDIMDLSTTEQKQQNGNDEPTLDGAAISAEPAARARALSGDNDADDAVGTGAIFHYRMAAGASVYTSPGSIPTASSGASMNKVLENSIAHYEDKIPAFWYASHIAMLNDIKSDYEASKGYEVLSKLVSYNFHFTDGIIRPQSLIGGWFNRGTLFSKAERQKDALSTAMNSTPSEIVEALARKRGFDGIEIQPENKDQLISAIFCWDLSSRGSKSRKALQAFGGDYINNGAQDLIQVDPSDVSSKSIEKATVLRSLVYNGLKSYLSDKTKSWTDKLSKVIAKLKQRRSDSDYQALDDQPKPIIAEKNRLAANSVCTLFNLGTEVMDPNTYEGLHDQDALGTDIDAHTVASRISGV